MGSGTDMVFIRSMMRHMKVNGRKEKNKAKEK